MPNSRKRDWSTRDFIRQAKERGYLPDIGVNLDNLPTLPESETTDPAYNRVFYVGKFSDRSLAELKSAAYDEMIYQQWLDFQSALNEDGYTQAIDGRPQASWAMQDAFNEVMKMQGLNFPVILLPLDTAADFLEYASLYYENDASDVAADKPPIDNYKRDFVWSKWYIVKQYNQAKAIIRKRNEDGTYTDTIPPEEFDTDGNPVNSPFGLYNRGVDNTVEDYDKNTPCLIIFTRKAVYGGSVFFTPDIDQPELLDNTSPLVQIADAIDFYDIDPRVATLIDNNSIRVNDGWLQITIPQSALAAMIPGILDNIDPPPGAGTGDPQDPFGCGDCPGGGNGGDPPPIDPTDPPPGTVPPDPSNPPGTPTPPTGIGDRATFDCDAELLYNESGTNHTHALIDFSYSQNAAWFFLGLQSLTPVNSQDVQADIFAGIATAVEAWRVANSKPSTYQIQRIVLCVTYQRIRKVALMADGEETFITIDMDRFTGNPITGFSDPKPKFVITRGSNVKNQLVRGEVKRLGSWQYPVGGVEMQAIADVEIAEDVKFTLNHYQDVTGLVFSIIDVPATWQFFTSHVDIPVIKVGLESADLYYNVSKWSGHFDLRNIVLTENPNVPGQMLHFSDNPNGLISGMAIVDSTANFWAGGELAGEKAVLLNTPSPGGGKLETLGLMGIADGYVHTVDAAYTTARVTLRAIGGAQTLTLGIHQTAGGTPATFTQTMPDTGHFTSTPFTFAEVTVTFDISSLGLTTSSNLFDVVLAGQIYAQEWSVVLY